MRVKTVDENLIVHPAKALGAYVQKFANLVEMDIYDYTSEL